MMNEKTGWNKNIDKPRLLFYQFGLIFIAISFINFFENMNFSDSWQISNHIIGWIFFLIGAIICQSTWTGWFKNTLIPKVKRQVQSKDNFNLKINDLQLEKLFNGLTKYGFIEEKTTSLMNFKIVMKNNWHSHDEVIYFSLDGPGINEFYELLNKKFPSNSLNIKKFISTSGVIKNSKKKPYTYDTIIKARSRTTESKHSKKLNLIFSEI